MQLLDATSDPSTMVERGGGKAAGLQRLEQAGSRVPAWFALGSDVFDAFLRAHGLEREIEAVGAAIDVGAALDAAAVVRSRILAASVGADVRAAIAERLPTVGDSRVAVRSSSIVEDGVSLSYAGQFDSFLGVTGVDDVVTRVRDCWASSYSERAIGYAFTQTGRASSAGIAVVVQRLIDARVSGVVFTVDPITGNDAELTISAVHGFGEGLVSGVVDADTYVVAKSTGAIVSTHVGDKVERVVAGDRGTVVVQSDSLAAEEPALTSDEVAELTDLGRDAERSAGRPQDIEWAIDDDGLWVLQARPITAVDSPSTPVVVGAGETVADGDLRIWDNSNIIESFSGITSPLTFTTAAEIYGRVYRNYARSLRVPHAQLQQTEEWTPHLLGYFHGRVYYNLLHWYRMVGIAPGYALNRKVLEVALGVDEPLDTATARTLRPFTFGDPLARLRSRLITTVTYARRIAGIDSMVEEFVSDFYRVYDRYDAIDYDALTGAEVYRHFRTVDEELIDRWGPMMVLDAILLTSVGLLYALTKLFLPKAPEWFLYAVISPGADVESAEPATAMRALADTVRRDADLVAFVNTTPPENAYDALQQVPRWRGFAEQVDDYIDRYGYRSLDELKLETPDLRENPASLFVMLRSALPGAPPSRRGDADDYLDAHLHGVRRAIYERLRGKASRCAAHRESLRFCRTRAFGMVKRMIRALGRDLTRRGVLDEFTDVFELRLAELRDAFESPDNIALQNVVAERKAVHGHDSSLVAPARFVTHGSAFTANEMASAGWVPLTETERADTGAVLPGMPSSRGVVEGRAVVVEAPEDVAGGILVAYRTDPGWVAALPSASALVIERGSPLTHVAVVARELGLTTVVQVKDVTKKVRTGMHIRVDGTNGTVTVLPDGTDAPGNESR